MSHSHSGQSLDLSIGEQGRSYHPPVTSSESYLLMVANGDRVAFEELYRRFSLRVFGIARRVLRDASQAEEVAQEVFVHVWSHASRFDPAKGSALSWIMVVAHRRAVDRVRSSQAARERDLKDYRTTFQRECDPTGDSMHSQDEVSDVKRGLASLTDLQRESILLAYYDGLTHLQVGEVLGIPLGTVKSRIRDGIIRLRDSLMVA